MKVISTGWQHMIMSSRM